MILFGSELVSSPENIYTITVAMILILLMLYRMAASFRYLLLSCPFISSHVRPFLLNHVIYARSYGRFLGLRSVSRLHLLLAFLYITGTAVCNVIFVESLLQASTRAARLCLVNLIPTFLANHEFGARLFGINLQTYGFIHRSFAIISFLEGIVHLVIMLCTKAISLSDDSQFYGVLVYICPSWVCNCWHLAHCISQRVFLLLW